jgi:hypothetical protein
MRIYAYKYHFAYRHKYAYSEEKVKDLSSEIFENAILADPVLQAELLPELHTDLVPALSDLERDDLPRHFLFFSSLTGN